MKFEITDQEKQVLIVFSSMILHTKSCEKCASLMVDILNHSGIPVPKFIDKMVKES